MIAPSETKTPFTKVDRVTFMIVGGIVGVGLIAFLLQVIRG
jgi:hypothetical protein